MAPGTPRTSRSSTTYAIVKIDSLYEGTTGIQALDLFFRKIARDQGQTLSRLADKVLSFVKGGADEFTAERELLGSALEDVQAHIGVLVAHSMASMQDPPQIYKAGLHTNSLLESLSEVVIGWLLLRHAEIAALAIPDAHEADRASTRARLQAPGSSPGTRCRRLVCAERPPRPKMPP